MRYTFAIGDIHGCLRELHELVADAIAWNKRQPDSVKPKFVFVGDYVDRGPDSKGVVDFLIGLSQDYECVFIRGNHEDMLMNDFPNFLGNGGRATLKSYGWDDCTDYIMNNPVRPSLDLIPKDHMDFFRATRLYHKDGLRIYVHAGILRHHGAIENQSERVLLWIRHEFLCDPSMEGGYVVHGHTPMENGKYPEGRENRINLDTGCVFGGRMSAAVFDDVQVKPIAILQSSDHSKEGPYA